MKKTKRLKIFWEVILFIIYTLTCFFIIPKIFCMTKIQGSSMYPTLKHNQIVIVSKKKFDIKRKDIIITFSLKNSGDQIVKRVIGLPNEKLQIKNKKIYINDKLIDEPYVTWITEDEMDTKFEDPIIIPDDCYFVLGDNRDASYDSRQGGYVNKKDILGKVKRK